MNIHRVARAGVLAGTGVLICALCALVCRPVPSRASVIRVSGFEELRRELSAPGRGVVELQRDIWVSDMVSVRGEKILRGNGHSIRREMGREKEGGTGSEAVYGGVLLCARGDSLVLQDLVLAGGGERRELRGRIYGRLLEIRQGKVTVKSGCVLENNSNNGQKTDGGGGVVVRSGATLRITGGEIRGNRTAVGGAGIRVETGGRFVMTGGRIVANKAEGVGLVEGFDGRGGAIYNQGRMEFRGGKICYNEATAFESGGEIYGGVGGMLYNAGICLVTGGRIIGNRAAQAGGGIYSDRGAILRVKGGTWSQNRSRRGADIFRAGESGVERPVETKEKKKEDKQTKQVKETVETKQIKEMKGTEKAKQTGKTGKTNDSGESVSPEDPPGRKKSPPDIRTAPRYFFVREVREYSERQWRKVILEGVEMEDGRAGQSELRDRCRVDFGGLLSGRPGCYTVRLRVPYGGGRQCQAEVSVVLAEGLSGGMALEDRQIHFEPPAADGQGEKAPEEVWRFNREDVERVKEYMGNLDNPFSREANDGFLLHFAYCREEGEDE